MTDTAANLDDIWQRCLQSSRIWDDLPESKLALIDRRLLAGNSLAGSPYSAEDASPRQRAAFEGEAVEFGGAS